MNKIIIKTQAEFDALPSSFQERTEIIIQNDPSLGRIRISAIKENASVSASGSASVSASGSASVSASGSASVYAYNFASVTAYGSASVSAYNFASVTAYGSASVSAYGSASVSAYDSASVTAYGSASVSAYDSASVSAYDSASVTAYGSASVYAYDSASVIAYDSASVIASGSASVIAYGSASVSASGNASVVAFDRSATWLHSANAKIILFGFATCQVLAEGIVEQKSKNSTVIRSRPIANLTDWLANENVEEKDNAVILFKRVSHDLKTQEGTKNETSWSLGSILEHPAWSPEASECGGGKYHACSQPYFCDEFRFKHDDKYLAIKVSLPDLFLFSKAQYPHKIAFRKGEVLYEVNKIGGIK